METPIAADVPPIAADMEVKDLDTLTHRIIGAAFRVSSVLGTGFLEKVYENSLSHELRIRGLSVEQQHPVLVRYDGEVVGNYIADILVQGNVVVEIKAVARLERAHLSQCSNYLRATGLRICLLLNFGRPALELKRVVLNY